MVYDSQSSSRNASTPATLMVLLIDAFVSDDNDTSQVKFPKEGKRSAHDHFRKALSTDWQWLSRNDAKRISKQEVT